MTLEQRRELSYLSGYSMNDLKKFSEDDLWDLWEDTTTNINPMEYLAMECGAEDW